VSAAATSRSSSSCRIFAHAVPNRATGAVTAWHRVIPPRNAWVVGAAALTRRGRVLWPRAAATAWRAVTASGNSESHACRCPATASCAHKVAPMRYHMRGKAHP
jgi:hypothetical protein